MKRVGKGNTISPLNVALEGICVCFFMGHGCALVRAFKDQWILQVTMAWFVNEGEVHLPYYHNSHGC